MYFFSVSCSYPTGVDLKVRSEAPSVGEHF